MIDLASRWMLGRGRRGPSKLRLLRLHLDDLYRLWQPSAPQRRLSPKDLEDPDPLFISGPLLTTARRPPSEGEPVCVKMCVWGSWSWVNLYRASALLLSETSTTYIMLKDSQGRPLYYCLFLVPVPSCSATGRCFCASFFLDKSQSPFDS